MIRYYLKCKNVRRMGNIFTHRPYNLMEHQWMVGMLFRHFASLENIPYDINIWDIILKHDLLETESMDLPWPVKNLSPKVKECWGKIEDEVANQHFKLQRYTDEQIKEKLTPLQYNLFKVCDTLDLLLFVKEEIAIGNNTESIREVESNCWKIINNLDFDFPKVKEFIRNYTL